MFNYSIDTDIRVKIYGIIGIASASIASGLFLIVKNLPLPIAAPSGLAIFGILIFFFDRYLWRWPLINSIIGIPIIDGYWEGTLLRKTTDSPTTESREVKMTVTQRWTKINIVFSGESSKSEASVVGMNIDDSKQISIRWIYDSHDISGHPAKNLYGEGTTRVTLKTINGTRYLEGIYYSAKLTKGKIKLVEVLNG